MIKPYPTLLGSFTPGRRVCELPGYPPKLPAYVAAGRQMEGFVLSPDGLHTSPV